MIERINGFSTHDPMNEVEITKIEKFVCKKLPTDHRIFLLKFGRSNPAPNKDIFYHGIEHEKNQIEQYLKVLIYGMFMVLMTKMAQMN